MSEETEAVVAPVEQKKGGSTVAKVIGGAAGGYGAYKLGEGKVVGDGIRKVIKGAEEPKGIKTAIEGLVGKPGEYATHKETAELMNKLDLTKLESIGFKQEADKTFTMFANEKGARGLDLKGIKELPKGVKVDEMVTDPEQIKKLIGDEKSFVGTHITTLEGKLGLASQHKTVSAIKGVKKVEDVSALSFVTDAKTNLHDMHVTIGKQEHVVKGLKELPKDIKAGVTLSGEQLKPLVEGEKSFLKTAVVDTEKSLVSGLKKGGVGFGKLSTGGKATVVVGTVAGVAAGAMILNRLFGGKHTNRVEADRANVEQQQPARA